MLKTNLTMHYEPDGGRVRLESGPYPTTLCLWTPSSEHMALTAFRDALTQAIEWQREHPADPVNVIFRFNDSEWFLENCSSKDSA